MDDFAIMEPQQRRLYVEQTAAKLGLAPILIEKDFWVCWTLRRLFAVDLLKGHLIFKGGTSLSKVYRIIERFSEDIDLSIDRAVLGYGGDEDPERASGGKQQRIRLDELTQACSEYVCGVLLDQLRDTFGKALGTTEGWSLSIDPDDPVRQTLLFRYPQIIDSGRASYIAPAVKIELGARSDMFPTHTQQVTSYVAQEYPESMVNASTSVVVMSAERTFWEKLTILHMLHHRPEEKKFPARMSRHYYDVFRLAAGEVCDAALQQPELLERVVVHKRIFFRSGWAQYETATFGTIRLRPSSHMLPDLQVDYESMAPMFFSVPPAFEDIMKTVGELEDRINGV